jgi:AcrR family transcriptional regulator
MPAYHFGSKEGLITRLAERAHERTLEATAKALARTNQSLDRLSGLETVRISIETYLEVFSADALEERAVIVMWGATFPSDSPLPAVLDEDRQTHSDLAGTIRAGQQDGSVRADIDVDAAAMLIMGMARGTAALSLAHAGTADPAKVRALCSEVITAALGDASRAAPNTSPRQTRPSKASERASR